MVRDMLPADFLEEIKGILTDETEYEQFLASYEEKRAYGLRFNPLKNDRETFLKQMPFSLSPVGWAVDGYYCDKEEEPGKHPYHEAGAYYIQEPSAMAVADLLEATPGEIICDLCAAPGGKSSQIAASMNQKGLLVANEIIPSRAKILSRNIERMGIRNAVVCNEPPERMAQFFPNFFDKILVDAPCSGEGMFRKNPEAIGEWSKEQVTVCRERQLFILEQAAGMLKAGGTLAYSTCTFNREEDEGVITAFLTEHQEFELVPIEPKGGICSGILPGTIRLWPHKLKGEGHFAAKLHKKDGAAGNSIPAIEPEKRKDVIAPFLEFQKQYLNLKLEGVFTAFSDEIYLVPDKMRQLKGMKILRPGLHLGTNKKNRFEPSQALAATLSKQDAKQYVTLKDGTIYLRGESFRENAVISGESTQDACGWTLTLVGDYSMGWSKCTNNTYKNHYPKGLRVQY